MIEYRFCPCCGSPLAWTPQMEDGGEKLRLRCTACDFTHWNNPTPVLAGIVQVGNQILLARNAAWSGRKFALITGFMEAGETPEEGISREIFEETNLQVSALKLIGVYDFQRMNQVIIAYHAMASGTVKLSPELAEYKMYNFDELVCWPAGTGYALGDWLRTQGIERGQVVHASRKSSKGTLNWQITVRDDGQRLFDGTLPTLIQWGKPDAAEPMRLHPRHSLPRSGVSLQNITVSHPSSEKLTKAFEAVHLKDIEVSNGEATISAYLQTPKGLVVLQSSGV